MTEFIYSGRDKNGVMVTGQLDRASDNDVANYLLKKRITPINIAVAKKKFSLNREFNQYFSKSTVPEAELIMFCRQMYTINKAGIPLIQGLAALSDSIAVGPLQACLVDITHRLETGVTLSVAMVHHQRIFNNLFIGMIKIGEETGKLDIIFLQLSGYIARDLETKKSIKSALRYPSFVLSAMVVALFVVNLMVIPAFADMFNRFSAELPLPTQVLMGMSNLFVSYWWLITIFLIVSSVILFMWIATPEGKLFWHKTKLRIPIVGVLVHKAAMSRYIRSFSLMLSAGVSVNRAIALCAEIIDNTYLSSKIKKIREGVERGDTLYRTHKKSDMFSPLILQMIHIGESSGQVDTLLMEVAESYEREVDYDLQSLSAKIEPILIVVMAGFVLVLALGIFLPMWEMFSIQS
jgi:MSHA biogenesis protein MshG